MLAEPGFYSNARGPRRRHSAATPPSPVNDPDLLPTVAWVPTLFTKIEAARKVPSSVQDDAGVFARCGGPSH